MKFIAIVCVALPAIFATAADARGGSHGGGVGGGLGGGLGMHSPTSVGGAYGATPGAPGTNSAGTALSSSGTGMAVRGAALGLGDPAVDQEDRKAARMVESICKGC